ncbi:hypothetical protein [Tsukamurella paurometabola]|uniref:Isochorismatase family protein n=1 Tax=Tsukamurella paurometabola TaxID=2061 RepID=A0ABS5NJG5_TSUPA|nr:hypothetical protein [Tsukamurella paurometabola]MBS4104450.1 hypothetical protein [Tsukamurella paurometabola]
MDPVHRLRASRTALVVVDVQGSFPTIAHDADPVPASNVIAHYNATFARLEYPGRSIIVAPSRRVAFVP